MDSSCLQAHNRRSNDRAKISRRPFQTSISPKSTKIGMLIFSDVCWPQVNSLCRAQYYLLFRYEYSNYRAVYFVKQKSKVSEHCKVFIALLHTQTGEIVTEFRSDGGTKYLLLHPWLKSKGIRHQTTCRYSPQQNAIERDNHTVVQLVRVLLYSNDNPTHSLGRSHLLRRLHSQPRPLFRKPYQNTIRAMVRTQSGCLQPASLCIRALRLHPEPTATEVRR
jgi:hypothetical protein